MYYEPANKTWFLFVNHIHASAYGAGVWGYWTKDINHWNTADKAVVLDRQQLYVVAQD